MTDLYRQLHSHKISFNSRDSSLKLKNAVSASDGSPGNQKRKRRCPFSHFPEHWAPTTVNLTAEEKKSGI